MDRVNEAYKLIITLNEELEKHKYDSDIKDDEFIRKYLSHRGLVRSILDFYGVGEETYLEMLHTLATSGKYEKLELLSISHKGIIFNFKKPIEIKIDYIEPLEFYTFSYEDLNFYDISTLEDEMENIFAEYLYMLWVEYVNTNDKLSEKALYIPEWFEDNVTVIKAESIKQRAERKTRSYIYDYCN